MILTTLVRLIKRLVASFDAFLVHHRQWMLGLLKGQFGQVTLGR